MPNWDALFGIHVPVAEILLRGSAVYWFLFLVFRFVLRRDVGEVGIADLLLLVLVADAAQNAMAGEYKSISEGLLLVGTIIAWNIALDWLAFQWPLFARFAQPSAVQLVRHGRVLQRSLRLEMLTLEELMAQLRQHGVEDLSEVKHAYLESDGRISVIPTRAR